MPLTPSALADRYFGFPRASHPASQEPDDARRGGDRPSSTDLDYTLTSHQSISNPEFTRDVRPRVARREAQVQDAPLAGAKPSVGRFSRIRPFTEATASRIMAIMSAGWVFLPVLGAPLAHGPVLRADLAPGLKRPISTRLFGENKTWRGALVMTGGTVAAALALDRVPAYRRRLPEPIANAHPAVVGGLLGLGSWVGELPNSFIKRRIGIAPGQQRHSPAGLVTSIFDQADWVPIAALLLRPIWRMTAREIAMVFVLVVAVHVPINVIGYALGARKAPI